MDNNDLNAIANELLTAFFNKSDHTELIRIADRYQIPITGKIFKKATERAIGWLESGDTTVFDVLTPENRDRIIASGLKNISEKFGATLGKDFSKVDDGLLITNELMSKIMADMSPKERSEFQGKGFAKKVTTDPFKMLEDSLGVPFFTSLEAIVKLRVQSLDDVRTAGYISFLAGGMQNKHSWISDEWMIRFFHRVLGADRFKAIMKLGDMPDDDKNRGDVGALVFDDLLTAMGRTDRRECPELGMTIGRADILALDKVFRGEKMSCAEMAELVRRAEDEHRRK
jgi:hypothetical protein